MQAHPAFRMALHEVADQQGRQVVAHRQGGADLQRAEAAVSLQQLLDLAGAVEQGDRLGQQLLAEGAERQALADAVEQRAVVVPLEFRQRGAGCRLRQRQRLGGTGDALQAGDGDEDFQLSESKAHIYITDYLYFNYSFSGCFVRV
ncbi:hypothetical protein D3C81_1375510 [compost metagenome]